jgi:hypothetical protein
VGSLGPVIEGGVIGVNQTTQNSDAACPFKFIGFLADYAGISLIISGNQFNLFAHYATGGIDLIDCHLGGWSAIIRYSGERSAQRGNITDFDGAA